MTMITRPIRLGNQDIELPVCAICEAPLLERTSGDLWRVNELWKISPQGLYVCEEDSCRSELIGGYIGEQLEVIEL